MLEIEKENLSEKPMLERNVHIIDTCADYVLEIFNEKADSRLTFHNYQHTIGIIAVLKKIATTPIPEHPSWLIPKTAIEIATIAAWFRNTGFLFDYDKPLDHSIRIAKDFLNKQQYPIANTEKVINCLVATGNNRTSSIEEQLLMDAINGYQYTADYFDIHPLLRLEWELLQNKQISILDWNQIQLQYLLKIKFYTPFGKLYFEPVLANNILLLKNKVQKSLNSGLTTTEENGSLRKFQGLERKLPSDATQTFFRTNYRNHINLSNIADNKANIMISVNAILISVLISMLTYKNITETNPVVLLPIVIFLFTGLVSLIFAVLSIRPKVTSMNPTGTKPEIAKRNIVFFGNFVHLKLEEYEEAVDAMFRDGELIYGNMVRDIYFLGKVLDKKYRYLTLAYNTFMVGFIATVITFLVAIFI
jgi:pycsar effector protein